MWSSGIQSEMICKTTCLIIIVLESLLLQKLQARTLSAEGLLTLQTTSNNSKANKNGTYRIKIIENGNHIEVTEETFSKRRQLEDLCPEDSDCEEFLKSIKYFCLEFFATFAGLSWGAWSNLVLAFNHMNS